MNETRLKLTYDDLDKLSHDKICELISEGVIDRKYAMGYMEHTKVKAFSVMRQKDKADGKEYNYPTFEFGMAAYTYALENSVGHKEALEFASKFLGKDDEWLQEVRHKRFNHSKEVYNEHKEHPVQKKLSKEDYFDPSVIKNSTSVTQMTKRVLIFKDVHSTIDKLSDDVECLEGDVEQLKVDRDTMLQQIDNLHHQSGIETLSKKDIARNLKSLGWSNKSISEQIDVNRRTLTRWFKDS